MAQKFPATGKIEAQYTEYSQTLLSENVSPPQSLQLVETQTRSSRE